MAPGEIVVEIVTGGAKGIEKTFWREIEEWIMCRGG